MEIEFLIPTDRVVEFKRAVKETDTIKILKCNDFDTGSYFIKVEVDNPYDLIVAGVTMGINQCYDSIGYREAKAAVGILMGKVQDFVDKNNK